MADDVQVKEAEGLDPAAGGVETPPPAGDGVGEPGAGYPGADRLLRERDEALERVAALDARLKALEGAAERQNRPDPRKQFDEEFEKNPAEATWNREQRLREEMAMERSREQAHALANAHPAMKTDPKFRERFDQIAEELYPNDPEFKKTPAHVQVRNVLKLYDSQYGTRARDEIRTPPAGGKIGTETGKGDAKPTASDWETALADYHKPPFDKDGRGVGAQRVAGWKAKGWDGPPEE